MLRESLGVDPEDGGIEGGLDRVLVRMVFVGVDVRSQCSNRVWRRLQQNGLDGAQLKGPQLGAEILVPQGSLVVRQSKDQPGVGPGPSRLPSHCRLQSPLLLRRILRQLKQNEI